MTIYVQLQNDTVSSIVDGPGVPSERSEIDVQRNIDQPLRIQFLDGDNADTPKRFVTGTDIRFGLKDPDELDGGFLALADSSAFTEPATDDTNPFYVATFSTNTEDMDDFAGLIASVVLSWKEPAAANPNQARIIPANLLPAGDTGEEGVPTDADPSFTARLEDVEERVFTGVLDAIAENQSTSIDISNINLEPGILTTKTGLKVGLFEGTQMSALRFGRVTLVAGGATVSDAYVTADTRIFLTRAVKNGTAGATYAVDGLITPGVSFDITSRTGADALATLDTSTIDWLAIEPS